MKEPRNAPHFYVQKKKKKKTKQKNIYVQNGRSKTRVAYEKGEAKERVREKMQKID